MFWGDEIMGDYTLNAGSWHTFLQRWHAGIDSSGFWFYVFAKPWEMLFGRSEVSLRLFSASGVATSAAILWITARRFYSTTAVAIAIAVPYLDLVVLRWQLSNGRSYGVLMSAAALVIWLIVKGQSDSLRRPGWGFLALTFCTYDILTGCHILGILFAGMFLCVQIVADLRGRRLRIPLYVAAAVGMAAIELFSLQNIRSTTALGKPVFWTNRPHMNALWFMSAELNNPLRVLLVGLLLLTLLQLRRKPGRDILYLVFLGFLGLYFLYVLVSQISTSIYVDRYMLPFVLGLSLLLAELLTQLGEHSSRRVYVLTATAVALWGLVCLPARHPFVYPLPDYTGALLASLPPGLPVVDSDIASFVEVEYYHHGRMGRPFLCPLDPGVTADVANTGGVSGYREMDNFFLVGLDSPDLQPTSTILARYPHFLALTGGWPTIWLSKRILQNPAYRATDLGELHFGFVTQHVWDVQALTTDTSNAGPGSNAHR